MWNSGQSSGSGAKSIEAADVHRMCQTIVHRGPDDEGVYAQGPVGLGMRRLSIIDLAGGKQPIHNEDRTVWVVFNGEIYNFPELRRELEGRGHQFYTHSDTEVIVHLYEEMGADCVKKLRGMFAIALYDAEASTRCCWRATGWARSRCTTLCIRAGCCLDRRSRRFSRCIRNWRRSIPKDCCSTSISDIFPIRTPCSSGSGSCLPGT